MTVKQQPVNINIQTILAIIPIVSFWAAYRIEKFRFWCLLCLGMILLSISIRMILPFPYGIVLIIIIEVIVAIFLMRHWSKEWNEKFPNSGLIIKDNKPVVDIVDEEIPFVPKDNEDKYSNVKLNSPSIEILKERYAKGEITKEEFDRMKEDLST